MVIHFSQFAGFLIPFASLIVPVILWQLKRVGMPELDPHGRAVTNWVLSLIVYGLLCLVLLFGLIGIPLALMLGVLALIFPVIGGIKAGSGEVWTYPLSIPFLK
jgi:uncharacterized Tic20 family protein